MTSPGQPSILSDPMLRSALFFTGANRYRQGLPPLADTDDGVLTAYEASQLNLAGTELVVLSACKTGLGQARNGEGVFGLRRAFHVAGAQAVMMTMWSVPDRETQTLMTLFYEKWLAGADKHEALRAAQRELQKKTNDPSTWGAFVLVGR
jgi:CHAT domain-containing protein